MRIRNCWGSPSGKADRVGHGADSRPGLGTGRNRLVLKWLFFALLLRCFVTGRIRNTRISIENWFRGGRLARIWVAGRALEAWRLIEVTYRECAFAIGAWIGHGHHAPYRKCAFSIRGRTEMNAPYDVPCFRFFENFQFSFFKK